MKRTLLVVGFLSACLTTLNSAPFQNLGFDNANTNNLIVHPEVVLYNPPYVNVGSGAITDLLPGWQLYHGSMPYADLFWLNLNPIGGGALVSIYDVNNYFYNPQVHIPVEQNYSFAIEPSDAPGGGSLALSLVQTGDVPADAQTIRFTSFGREVQLYLNGTSVPVSYTYGPSPQNLNARLATAVADVSAFAGQTVELKFVTLPTFGTGTILNGLDSIYFSPVPEPSTPAIFALGLLSIGFWRLRRGTFPVKTTKQ